MTFDKPQEGYTVLEFDVERNKVLVNENGEKKWITYEEWKAANDDLYDRVYGRRIKK